MDNQRRMVPPPETAPESSGLTTVFTWMDGHSPNESNLDGPALAESNPRVIVIELANGDKTILTYDANGLLLTITNVEGPETARQRATLWFEYGLEPSQQRPKRSSTRRRRPATANKKKNRLTSHPRKASG